MEIKEEPLDMIKKEITQFICEICYFEAPDQNSLDLHFTKKHGQQDGQSVQTPDQSNNKLMGKLKMSFIKKYRCEICHFNPVKGMSLEMHLATKKHLKMKNKLTAKPLFKGAHRNSNGLKKTSELSERLIEGKSTAKEMLIYKRLLDKQS